METISKNVLLQSLESMPENIDVEQVIEQIILLSKIERGQRQIENGQFYTHKAIVERFRTNQIG